MTRKTSQKYKKERREERENLKLWGRYRDTGRHKFKFYNFNFNLNCYYNILYAIRGKGNIIYNICIYTSIWGSIYSSTSASAVVLVLRYCVHLGGFRKQWYLIYRVLR